MNTRKPRFDLSSLKWRQALKSAVLATCLLCGTVLLTRHAEAQTTNIISNATPSSVRIALAQGGTVILDFTGTVAFTTPLVITASNTVLESIGDVVFSGNNTSGLFVVASNVSFTVSNLVSRQRHRESRDDGHHRREWQHQGQQRRQRRQWRQWPGRRDAERGFYHHGGLHNFQ